MASERQSTVGSPTPSTCHVAPLSLDCITLESAATVMRCGVALPSITTECSGRSGRLLSGLPPSVPLMSSQLAPLFVVRKTCFVRLVGGRVVNPEYTTTTVFASVGSMAMPSTEFAVGALVTVTGAQLVPPLLDICADPFASPTQKTLEF